MMRGCGVGRREYQQYLAGGVEDDYNAMVAQITEEFSGLSKKVRGAPAST